MRNLLQHESVESFELMIDDQKLVCDHILRLMPKKRVVAAATWNKQAVVAKIFVSTRAKLHLQRELLGHAALKKIGLIVPEIIYQGVVDVPGIYVVLYHRCELDCEVDDVWRGYDEIKLNHFIQSVQAILATQHKNNIHQSDLHPKNFLISSQDLYCIDFSSLILNNPLSQKKEILILAGFYAQLLAAHQHLIEKWFEQYCQLRGWQLDEKLLAQLQCAVSLQSNKRIAKLMSRVLRNASAVKFVRRASETFACLRGLYQSYALDFFELPDEYLHSVACRPLKLGRSSSVYHMSFSDISLTVKRFNVTSLWTWFKRSFRRSKARKTWLNAHALQILGIPSAKPVAFLDNHFLGLNGSSYFICEYVRGDLLQAYAEQLTTEKEKNMLVERIENIFHLMFVSRICHRDCKASNFVVGDDGQIYLIDIDNLKIYKNIKRFKNHFEKDVDRFLRNWEEGSFFKKQLEDRLRGYK